MNVLLAALTSLLIAVFAAAFAAPYVVDWNEYRSVFEAQASKLAGRPVRVAGDVDLTILPVPEVRFEQVSIADRTGSFDAPAATAQAFRMALSIPPLLRGQVEARKIELDRLALRLGLDENGRVDWPRIGDAASALPFMPADVSLKSVTLNEASLEVGRPGEPARWGVEGVTGELSAETLRGPFKFAGQAMIGDQIRNLQLSIGTMTPDGLMPVKAVSRGDEVVYRAEGNLRELTEGPEFVGNVEASAPLPADVSAQTQQPDWRASATGRATLDGANFDDLRVTITRQQRPQTLDGAARLTWGQGLRLDAELRSQWLDLDLLAGAQVEDRTPAEVLLELPSLLADVPVPARQARIDMQIAQVSLGGDLIRDVHALARRGDGGWGVEKLEAGLPGGSGFSFEGRFARNGSAPILSGTVHASGGNLGRLLQWAAPALFEERDAAAKSFSLSGQVESAAEAFSLSQIAARLGDSRFGGSVRLAFDEASATVDLNARTLDLRPYIRGGTADIVRRLMGGEGLGLLNADTWQVALRANRLILPEFAANDVETLLRIDAEAVFVERVALRGADGLKVEASGRYPLGPSQAPELQLSLSADSADRAAELASAIPGGSGWLTPNLARLRAAMPLHLTASLRPSGIEDGYWLRIDGTAAQTELLANARLYSAGRYHIALSAENRTLAGLVQQVAPGVTDWLNMEDASQPARLNADFVGAAGEPWAGTADIATDAVRLAFDGTAAPGMLTLDGAMTINAVRAGDAFALVQLPAGEDRPLAVRASVSSDGSVYRARDLRIDLAGEITTGNARLDVSGAVPDVEMNLNAAHFNLVRAAALVLGEWPDGGGATFWPDTPFAMEALRGLSGSLSLAADELAVADGLSLNDATLTARLEDGALRVPMLSGMLYGGEAVASAELRPARGRMVFEGELALTELNLAQLPHGPGEPLATGAAELTLRAQSEGLSPRGLMTVMSGAGRIALGAGEFRGLDPQVLARTAREYLAAEQQPEETLAVLLAAPLRASPLAHDGVEAPLQLKDGSLRVPVTEVFKGQDGLSVTANARIDLSDMALTSSWDVGAALGGAALPEVRVTFAGPLWGFGTLQPRIDADDLEQFLTVARVERNVERLEELRRERDAAQPPAGESAPAQGLSSANPEDMAAPPPDDTSLGNIPLETIDPLPGFATEIEEVPAPPQTPTPGAARAADPPSQPASATATPGASLEDPDVVEDARREIMRDAPRRPQPEPERDSFFEIFRN